jgi:sigma-B regulation protein RsbU (phosphoserine phosphatase)
MQPGATESANPGVDERLRRIEAITDVALIKLGIGDLLHEMLDGIRDVMQIDTAAILLLDASGRYLVTAAARGLDESERQRAHIPVGQGFAGRVAAERSPIVIDPVTSENVVNPVLVRSGIRAILGVPLVSEGNLIGVLHVGTRQAQRQFADEDIQLLIRVAELVSSATRTRLDAEDRAAAQALQRSLLPSQLPRVPGLDFAARYVPGEGSVSGDWYDVFTLPGGRVGVVMGDVAGHGLRASVVMGRLRSALRAYALEHDDPAYVLHRLDVKIHYFETGAMATALYAVTEPPFDRIRISSAGHLPPMLVMPGGAEAHLTDVPPDLPLGVDPSTLRRSTTVRLPVGSSLALFTDGLVERRTLSTAAAGVERDPIDHGLAELARVLRPGSAESACTRVMDHLLSVQAPDDDVALLVLSRTATTRHGGDVP